MAGMSSSSGRQGRAQAKAPHRRARVIHQFGPIARENYRFQVHDATGLSALTEIEHARGVHFPPLNPADRPAESVSKFGTDTPMKRASQPEEIAPAYVFFAAPSCSSYITGELLPIIGGYD